MKLTANALELHMREAIDRYFSVDAMRQYAHTYVDDKLKEAFHFGNLCLFHYEMFDGEPNEDIHRVAAALELLILSSDILDDIQDQDAPSKPWMQTPAPLALNVAFSLLMLGQQLMQEAQFESSRLKLAVETVNRNVLRSLNGQMRDLMNDASNTDDYMDMVNLKSASLVVMSCMVGVILADGKWNENVESYARDMGMMAQLTNDLRDCLRSDEKSDVMADKHTLPMLYNKEELSSLANLDPAERLQLFQENGTILYMQVLIKTHYYGCMDHFDLLPQAHEWKARFETFFESIGI
ncbi:polyprenyl synthetase family protein [Paenibacillus marinisediminis]